MGRRKKARCEGLPCLLNPSMQPETCKSCGRYTGFLEAATKNQDFQEPESWPSWQDDADYSSDAYDDWDGISGNALLDPLPAGVELGSNPWGGVTVRRHEDAPALNYSYDDPEEHECACCGKFFIAPANKIYCSKHCRKKAYSLRRAERGGGNKSYPVRQCVICGKDFQPHTDQQKTCGGSCNKEYMRRTYHRGLSKNYPVMLPFTEGRTSLEPIEKNERFLEQLKRHEGAVRTADGMHKAYLCPSGKLTIGYGHNLDANPIGGMGSNARITEAEATRLLSEDCASIAAQLDKEIGWWRELKEPRQAVLLNMAFNLGVAGLLGFRNTLRYVRQGQYAMAQNGMLNSKWARQVKARARELSRQMLFGIWQDAEPVRRQASLTGEKA